MGGCSPEAASSISSIIVANGKSPSKPLLNTAPFLQEIQSPCNIGLQNRASNLVKNDIFVKPVNSFLIK